MDLQMRPPSWLCPQCVAVVDKCTIPVSAAELKMVGYLEDAEYNRKRQAYRIASQERRAKQALPLVRTYPPKV